MTSSRPYLIRAIYQWIADNGCTPQIVVDAQASGVRVPTKYVEDGRIVLNISAAAVRGLTLGDERIEFNARFGGTPYHVSVPTGSVIAMVARENGTGMSFPDEPTEPAPDEPPPDGGPPKGERPKLRVVK